MASMVFRMIRVSSFDCDIKSREWGSFLIDPGDLLKPTVIQIAQAAWRGHLDQLLAALRQKRPNRE
jgi:hypothetical protein